MLDVRILTGRSAGKRYLLPRIPFRSGSSEFPFILRRRQFPVRLAWAMSIHKAQGQTLTRCGVFLPEPVFTHGQLYVCASRASSALGLRIWLGEPIDGHGYHAVPDTGEEKPNTLNIIFQGVLSEFAPMECHMTATEVPDPTAARISKESCTSIDPEYVDLSEAQETALHKSLFTSLVVAPAESGAIDLTLDADASATLPDDFQHRAKLLKLSPSVWFEVSQRAQSETDEFLKDTERQHTPGASSSAG